MSTSNYQFYKQRGICPYCKKEKPEPGKVACRSCIDKQKHWAENMTPEERARKKARTRELAKLRYKKKKAAGVCAQCGKVPPTPGRTYCEKCAEQRKKYYYVPTPETAEQYRETARAYNKARYERRKAAGLCTRCGEPAAPGKTNCENCLRKMRENMRRRREEKE